MADKRRYWISNKDCLDLFPRIKSDTVDTVITDPPYGINFMGRDWDHGVPGVGFWTPMLRVCKPGAMLLAFGGTRTYHRLTCGIEDAGWEIRDCMMWLYGSGFPKSHDISKAIDKAAGAEREVVGPKMNIGHVERGDANIASQTKNMVHGYSHAVDKMCMETAPATEAAKLWGGYGTALKPAWEPIVLAMKPLDGTFAQNALAHGVAGINVDGGRIGTSGATTRSHQAAYGASGWRTGHEVVDVPAGRWPANLILQHHPECRQVGVKKVKGSGPVSGGYREGTHKGYGDGMFNNKTDFAGHADADGLETVEAWECHADCPVGMLDRQSGIGKSGVTIQPSFTSHNVRGFQPNPKAIPGYNQHGDTGGASRFFYCAKAGRKERGGKNKHPTVKPLEIMKYLCLLTKTPEGGIVLDPFMGSGTTGVACAKTGRRFIGCENDTEEQAEKEERDCHYTVAKRRIRKAYQKKGLLM